MDILQISCYHNLRTDSLVIVGIFDWSVLMIALACDHGGYGLMQQVKSYLADNGISYNDFGTYSTDSCDYPVFADLAGHAVASGDCDFGILICGTGIGMSIAANKISGIRAALCCDVYMAEMARNHNDANVLVLGARVLEPELAIDIIKTFFSSNFDGGRHADRVRMLDKLDGIEGVH